MDNLNLEILANIQQLPPELRENVSDYVSFLLFQREQARNKHKEPHYVAEIDSGAGIFLLDESLEEPFKLYKQFKSDIT
ncbi:MAG: DUF2281 domain-containing protein [Bacteroidia bacterium]